MSDLPPEATEPYRPTLSVLGDAPRVPTIPPRPSMAPPSEAPRRRGRPPGSRNRTTVTPPAGIPRPGDPTDDEKAKAAREAAELLANKKARAAELGTTIVDVLNEKIAAMLMTQLPVELVYKAGQAPSAVAATSKYTEFAGRVMLNADQAMTFGRFIAELEQTNIGKGFSNATGSGNAGLLMYGALSAIAALQYTQGLKAFMDDLKKLQDVNRMVSDIPQGETTTRPTDGRQFIGGM